VSKLAHVRLGQARIAPQNNRANRATRNLRESRLDGPVARAARPCNLRDSRRSRNTPVTMERAEAIWLGRDPYLQDVAVPHHAGGRVASDHGDGGGDLVVERSATPGCCRPSPCRHVLHRGPEVDPREQRTWTATEAAKSRSWRDSLSCSRCVANEVAAPLKEGTQAGGSAATLAGRGVV
jgi:hypothetical protein